MKVSLLISLAFLVATVRCGYDPGSKSNFVIYWGQGNGLGEKDLTEYCKTDDYNIIAVISSLIIIYLFIHLFLISFPQ